jgi:hypothetical protein
MLFNVCVDMFDWFGRQRYHEGWKMDRECRMMAVCLWCRCSRRTIAVQSRVIQNIVGELHSLEGFVDCILVTSTLNSMFRLLGSLPRTYLTMAALVVGSLNYLSNNMRNLVITLKYVKFKRLVAALGTLIALSWVFEILPVQSLG